MPTSTVECLKGDSIPKVLTLISNIGLAWKAFSEKERMFYNIETRKNNTLTFEKIRKLNSISISPGFILPNVQLPFLIACFSKL